MTRTLLALSFLFFAVASYAEVVGERPVSTIVYGPAPGQQYGTAVASDGHDFLVAWIDAQRNRSGVPQIYATRMTAAGEILDPLGIRIAAVSIQLTQVNVVFLGNAYLVYWTEPPSGVGSVAALMAVRISRDGVLLDSVPRLLASPGRVGVQSAASNGNRTVILAGKTIVLDRDGNVVAEPKAFTNFGVSAAMIASNGRGFLIAWWLGGDSIYETLLDDAGAVTAPQMTKLSSGRFLYDLASDGDGYVVIVGDGTHTAAQHVSGAGELLERSAVPMQQYIPGFVFAAGSYLLMDADPQAHTIGVRRLDRSGKPAGDYVPVAKADLDAPPFGALGTLASNGSDTAAFWSERRPSARTVNGGVLHAGAVEFTRAEPLARSANAQYGPHAATNGRNIAVVWSESDGVYTGRLTLDGQMLDGRGIRIANAGGSPDIVFDGTNYLIGWAERSADNLASSVKVARLFPDFGTVLDPGGITVSSSPCVNALSLSVGSESTLVAWSDCKHILANTVDRNGLIGTAAIVTPPASKETSTVSAAWNGREWLVAWEDRITIPSAFEGVYTQTFIKAARLSPSLTLLDPRPISLTDSTSDVTPIVASDGNDFLVVWTLPPGAMAQRISADGSLLGTANGVRIGSGSVTSVVWDGLQYDVAFSSYSYGNPSTLYVTHVASRGPIEGTAAQAVVSNLVPPNAALIVTRPGHVVTVYSDVPSDAIYGSVERIFVNAPHAIRERAAGLRSHP
jgi:large repetitive protein